MDRYTEDWMDAALCAQVDLAIFFPDKGGSTKEAKGVCASCEVKVECLTYALEHREPFGIWGGLSERERRKLIPHATKRISLHEGEIMRLHHLGWTAVAIAVRLGVSRRTVERVTTRYTDEVA